MRTRETGSSESAVEFSSQLTPPGLAVDRTLTGTPPDAVLFGTPTRYGAVAAQLKQYIDGLGPLWQRGALADKVYAGFTSSATLHGGQESTLLTLYNNVIHFGGIIVPPGYTHPSKFVDGNPYGASHVAGQGDLPVDDTTRQAVRHETERVISVASKLVAGS